MKKAFLTLLVAAFVLSMGIGTANAAWTSSFGTAKKILQNANATTLASQSAVNCIGYMLGAGETLNTNDTLVLTLSGGAKFSSTAPTLSGSTTAGDGAGFSIVGSATGNSTANFRVAASQAVGNTITVNVEGTIFNVSAVTGNVDVSLAATTSVGAISIFNSAQSSKTGAAYAFSAPSAMETVSFVANTNVADVSATTGAFTKFTGATVTGNAAGFNYSNMSELINSAPSGQSSSAGTVVFNIAGILTGITSISGAGCTGSTSAGVTTGGTANFFLIDTAKTNAYCVNTAPVVQGIPLALAPVFTLDGTTAQSARAFTGSVNALVDGTKWTAHTAATATALYSITRNGSSFVTNSVGARNTIKITDRSGGLPTAGGAVTITAYNSAGTAIPFSGTAQLLLNNATLNLTGTQLAAFFPTGTPMRYDFAIESSSIVVTNVKASADGTMSATTVFTSGAVTATGIAQGI
jgi:hypothetical protein